MSSISTKQIEKDFEHYLSKDRENPFNKLIKQNAMSSSSNSSIPKKPEKKVRKVEELEKIEETKEIFERIDEDSSKINETIKISQKQEQKEQRELISYHKSKEESESLLKAISAKMIIKDYNIFSDYNKKSQKFVNLDQNDKKKKIDSRIEEESDQDQSDKKKKSETFAKKDESSDEYASPVQTKKKPLKNIFDDGSDDEETKEADYESGKENNKKTQSQIKKLESSKKSSSKINNTNKNQDDQESEEETKTQNTSFKGNHRSVIDNSSVFPLYKPDESMQIEDDEDETALKAKLKKVKQKLLK